MKKLLLVTISLFFAFAAFAARIYVNPGHGTWTSSCRPMGTIPYPLGANNLPDTLGFYESNTNLWKGFYLRDKLVSAGHTVQMSRTANGGTHQATGSTCDKPLSVICTEVNTFGADLFISIHSNAANTSESNVNYAVIFYRLAGAKTFASAVWQKHIELFDLGIEPRSYNWSGSNPNTQQNSNYGVLKHSSPGILSEGYFHTYQPSRHRALNPDWCCQEGLRYFRGIQSYLKEPAETKGYIMGYVRTKEKSLDQTYYEKSLCRDNDIYMPINGAKVQLRDENGTIVQTNCYPYVARQLRNQNYYTTDNNYNGVFVFSDLTPGNYTITVYKDGYADYTENLTVTADKTTYTQVFLTSGQGSSPAETSTTLNPYAYDVNAQLSQDQHRLTVSFKLNAPADVDLTTQTNKGKGVQVYIINKEADTEEERRCDTILIPRADLLNNSSPGKEVGEYEYTINTACLPRNVDLGLEIVVHGLIHSAPVQETTYHELYCPQGVAVDTDPTSPYFGRILVTEALHDITGTAKTYLSETAGGVVKAGIYAFHPNFTPINPNGAAYNGGYNFDGTIDEYYIDNNGNVVASTATGATKIMRSHQPWHVKISEDGRIFVSALDPRSDAIAVWELSKDLQTWTPIIQGESINANYDMLRNGKWFAGPNLSMDLVGSGDNLKLLLYSVNKQGWQYDATGYRLDEYAIGTTKTAFTGTPTPITAFSKTQNGNIAYGVIHMHSKVIYDGEGGYWFASSRNSGNEKNLAHVSASGTMDYSTNDKAFHGGSGIMIHQSAYLDPQYGNTAQKWLFKGVDNSGNSNGVFKIYVMSKNASGAPVLTERWTVTAAGLGRYVNGYAVDYAQNLYVVGNSGEKLVAFALPYSGVTTTPYNGTFQITTTDATCTVEVETMNSAWGTVSGGGCYYVGEDVTVTATTKNGASFFNWTEGSTVMSEDANYTFIVSKNITLTANFVVLSSEVTWHNLLKSADHSNIDVDTNQELWELLMPNFNDYVFDYGVHSSSAYYRATQSIEYIACYFFDPDYGRENVASFMTNTNSQFKWLGDYILEKTGKSTLTDQEWAYNLAAFFNQCQSIISTRSTDSNGNVTSLKYSNATIDFSTAGQPSQWLPYYREYVCSLKATMEYEDKMPININALTYTGKGKYNNSRPAVPSWYTLNDAEANPDKLLAWYYEEDPDNPTWPENPTIVHHVDHSGALFATWVEKRIYEDKNNVDVIKLMQNPQHTTTHNLYVNRKLVGGMLNTISFPFTVELDGLSNSHLLKTNNAKAYEFVGVSDTDEYGNIQLLFDEVRRLERGIPYLMQVDNDITEPLYFSGIDKNDLVYEGGSSETHSGITFHAVVSPTHIPEKSIIVVANNRIALTSDAGEMLGLRAYFTSPDTELLSLANTNKIKISLRQNITSDIPLAPEAEQPAQPKVQKIMRNGKIYILRGDEIYTITGARVR